MAQVKTVQDYTNWMSGLATQTMPGCSYEVHFSGWAGPCDKQLRHIISSLWGNLNLLHSLQK